MCYSANRQDYAPFLILLSITANSRMASAPGKGSMFQRVRSFGEQLRLKFIRLPVGILVGLSMLLVGLIIVDTPPIGVITYVIRQGISPRFYALMFVACGAILVSRPRTRAFIMLSLPLLVHCVFALMYYGHQPAGQQNFVPVVFYFTLYVLILRAGLSNA